MRNLVNGCSSGYEIGGFAPHIDAVAYTQIKNVKHLTILLSVDPSNMSNGGLEVVDGSHEMTIPLDEKTHCIESDWVESQKWTPVELEAGMLKQVAHPLLLVC
jgi:ectoine hydroxylase-related dioxygenase (phytanoyl-CoA dioxygenase family)